VPGAFEASAELDHNRLATAEEIQRSGENVLRRLEAVASLLAVWKRRRSSPLRGR
jgi:hypothetical protein